MYLRISVKFCTHATVQDKWSIKPASVWFVRAASATVHGGHCAQRHRGMACIISRRKPASTGGGRMPLPTFLPRTQGFADSEGGRTGGVCQTCVYPAVRASVPVACVCVCNVFLMPLPLTSSSHSVRVHSQGASLCPPCLGYPAPFSSYKLTVVSAAT
ncbi:uncharacterized protein B0H18DRAFT_975552 [Fomitopsis serialis]|uniref:uncharacterized protein n=1 Tax=Fomitopsis serialis TaxID=139415 RepID=UPI0020078134|nr:uncharacterized protein B0H18DRAFT_975552 [Neoantrodia serialis]KAH9935369.1 hypothetical protein B0H18DRAFT_975552 [Neoantrodia serialis]